MIFSEYEILLWKYYVYYALRGTLPLLDTILACSAMYSWRANSYRVMPLSSFMFCASLSITVACWKLLSTSIDVCGSACGGWWRKTAQQLQLVHLMKSRHWRFDGTWMLGQIPYAHFINAHHSWYGGDVQVAHWPRCHTPPPNHHQWYHLFPPPQHVRYL